MSDARVEVPATADIAALVQAAGGNPQKARYENGWLIVRDLDQEMLSAAAEVADPLFGLRLFLKAAAKAEFDRRMNSGIPFRNKVADMDEAVSIPRINGAVTGALIAQAQSIELSIPWRMADNSFLVLSAADLIILGQLVLTYFQMLNAKYWSIIEAGEAATTAEALAAINPLTGWPAPPVEP